MGKKGVAVGLDPRRYFIYKKKRKALSYKISRGPGFQEGVSLRWRALDLIRIGSFTTILI